MNVKGTAYLTRKTNLITVREQHRSFQNHRTYHQTYLLRVPYYGLLSAGPQNFREENCCEKGQRYFIGR